MPEPHSQDTPPTQRWTLSFRADIEARYDAETSARRSNELVFAGLVALAVYDLFLLNDWLSRPEVLGVALLWRLGVVSPYGLVVLALIRRGLPAFWREAAIASTTFVAMIGSCIIFRATTAASGVYDPFLFSLIFLAGNILFQLRFAMALISSAAGLALFAFFLLAPNALPDAAKPYVFGLLLASAIFTLLACYRLERAERRAYLLILREATRSEAALQVAGRFESLAETDPLTQLPNRRAFDRELADRWRHARYGQALAALVIDIDHFKRFNDSYGHPAGDACLRQVAQRLRQALRDDDFIARIGGEEFAVLVWPATEGSARQLAERLRVHVEGEGAEPAATAGRLHAVTVSLGVAIGSPPQPHTASELVASADAALYAAKRRGRNCWVMAASGPSSIDD